MDVVSKNRHGRSEKLHVFRFANNDELNSVSEMLRSLSNDFLTAEGEDAAEISREEADAIVEKLEARASSKYGHEAYQITSVMFEEELDDMVVMLLQLVSEIKEREEYLEKVLGAYRQCAEKSSALLDAFEKRADVEAALLHEYKTQLDIHKTMNAVCKETFALLAAKKEK